MSSLAQIIGILGVAARDTGCGFWRHIKGELFGLALAVILPFAMYFVSPAQAGEEVNVALATGLVLAAFFGTQYAWHLFGAVGVVGVPRVVLAGFFIAAVGGALALGSMPGKRALRVEQAAHQQTVAKLRQATNRLRAVAPQSRHLTPLQKVAFIAGLAKQTPQGVIVTSYWGNAESERYAKEIVALLKEQGWDAQWNIHSSLYDSPIVVASAAANSPAADALARAFNRAGIYAKRLPSDPSGPEDIAIRVEPEGPLEIK